MEQSAGAKGSTGCWESWDQVTKTAFPAVPRPKAFLTFAIWGQGCVFGFFFLIQLPPIPPTGVWTPKSASDCQDSHPVLEATVG